jgi:hypothetical protein
MEQRLVSVFLTTESDPDRDLSEHLGDYLEDGWRIVEFKTLGGSSGGGSATIAGWIVVLIERGNG